MHCYFIEFNFFLEIKLILAWGCEDIITNLKLFALAIHFYAMINIDISMDLSKQM